MDLLKNKFVVKNVKIHRRVWLAINVFTRQNLKNEKPL